jgi:hypothetical protein
MGLSVQAANPGDHATGQGHQYPEDDRGTGLLYAGLAQPMRSVPPGPGILPVVSRGLLALTDRTAVYEPVRTVVWQGSAGDRGPYADQSEL